MFGSTTHKLGALLLGLTLVLTGCGGSSDRGGFTNPIDVVAVKIRTSDGDNQLDANLGLNDCGLQTSKTVIVELFDQEGQFLAVESLSVDVVPGTADGVLCTPFPPGEESDPEDILAGNPCAVRGLDGPFSRAVFENSTGIQSMEFLSFDQPGNVSLIASAPDPNSGQQVSATLDLEVVLNVPVAPAVTSMAFTGPFVNAVLAGQNSLGLQDGEQILQDGTYQRLVSVVMTDENGNPPTCTGRLVDFFLIDGPLAGYPGQGPGSFAIAGPDGNPEEGGVIFSVPTGTGGFEGAIINGPRVRPLNDRLVLDGRQSQNPGDSPQPNNRIFTGIWRIEQVLNDDALVIEQRLGNPRATPPFPFNPAVADSGFSVPYLIGSALTSNILRTGLAGFSGIPGAGVASTILTYPVFRLGQTAALVACTRFLQDLNEDGRITLGSADRKTCAVLNTCDADGTNCGPVFLPVTNGEDIVLTADPTVLSANSTSDVTLCLRDRNFVPLPGTPIFYNFEGNLGSATVTVDGNPASSGSLLTGADGCTVATVASSGQAPGTESIFITFDADDSNPEPAVTVEIQGPGAGNLAFLLDCGGRVCIDRFNDDGTPITNPAPLSCTIDLLLTDDRGGPISDIPITHTSTEPLDSIRYNPAFGSFGITNASGANVVSVTANAFDAEFPTITFDAGAAPAVVTLGLPDCEDEAPVQPEATLVGGDLIVAPGETANLAVELSEVVPAGEQPVTVNVLITGDTGSFVELLPTSVEIQPGQNSAPLMVTATGAAADGDAITIDLTSGSRYVVGELASATVTVEDILPVATLAGAEETTLSPGGSTDFAVVLDTPATEDVTVSVLTTGDTGQFTVPTEVTIPAGASSAPLTITADSDATDGAVITLALTSGAGYTVGDPASATVTVMAAVANISAGVASVAPGDVVPFTVTLSEPAAGAITVEFVISGPGSGPSTVQIAAGSSVVTFDITADPAASAGDTITVTLVPGTGYTVGDNGSASAAVAVEPVVSIIAPGGSETAGTVTFTVQLDAASAADLSIPFALGGTATIGSDFNLVTTSPVQVPAGSTSAGIQVQIIDDAVDDDDETITITLQPGAGYTLGTASATLTITDNDP